MGMNVLAKNGGESIYGLGEERLNSIRQVTMFIRHQVKRTKMQIVGWEEDRLSMVKQKSSE